MDRIALEAGGLDEAMRAQVGLRITMGAAAGLSGVDELVAYAREGLSRASPRDGRRRDEGSRVAVIRPSPCPPWP